MKEHTIAAAAGILVIVPGPSYVTAFFENDEVARFVLPYHVNSSAHSYSSRQFIAHDPGDYDSSRLSRSPEIPAPIMTTGALVYSFLLPMLCSSGSYFGLALSSDFFMFAAMKAPKIFLLSMLLGGIMVFVSGFDANGSK